MARLAELKRKFDPMGLSPKQRGNFGLEAPEVATVGVSKEAMELGAKSNYGDQMSFQKRRETGSTQSGVNSDLQAVFSEVARRKDAKERGEDPSNPFFEIPATRAKRTSVANVPVAPAVVNNPVSPAASQDGQRSYENMERQQFLARERAEIQVPLQPTDVKPVRIMNENFLATQRNFGSASLKASESIPGVEISDMVDARTGRSIARFKLSLIHI